MWEIAVAQLPRYSIATACYGDYLCMRSSILSTPHGPASFLYGGASSIREGSCSFPTFENAIVVILLRFLHMRFGKRRPKTRSYQVPRVIAIAQKRSKSASPAFQGTIDKNIVLLRKFITAEGKILPRRNSHLTAKQQRYMARAIKNARLVGLLPFINKNQSVTT